MTMIASEVDSEIIASGASGLEELEVSIVLPCLNEAATLEGCIQKALGAFKACDISGEVIVVDNGSSDGS
jgi:glycosyltransferase involved in cell wall biosynthesis